MAVTANSHTIAGYLDSLGARYKRVTDTVTLLGFNSNARFYRASIPVEIRTSSQWITLRALLVNNVSGQEAAAVALYVGYLNSQCRGVRYSILKANVILTTEVHISRLSKETFAEALLAIITWASETTVKLRMLATNSSLADLYMNLDSFGNERGQNHNLTPDDILIRFDLRPTALETLLKQEVTKDDDTESE
jgi:hypothetical protein